MKLLATTPFLSLLCMGLTTVVYGQTYSGTTTIPVVSTAPVSYRVNEVNHGPTHGYYKKNYSLTIYGDTASIGFRADCDEDDDWRLAKKKGKNSTTQKGNSFEGKYKCDFDPNTLYGTVLPGNASGQHHFDGVKRLGVREGDVTITYRLDAHGKIVDSLIGVVFDRGPQNQPGESSVAARKKLKGNPDNNQFIYIVFPKSAKYLEQVVGTKANSIHLQRIPTNEDFVQAYQLMREQADSNVRVTTKDALVAMLLEIPLLVNFDEPTAKERADGLLKPANNDRNLNE